MAETRRPMSRAEFEQSSVSAPNGWWLTGEDAFLHVPAVMQVEGWNIQESTGFRKLTEAQRVLMLWADLVGQVANGGFEQFADNHPKLLRSAPKQLAQLDWPELTDRFAEASRERASNLRDDTSVWREWDPFFHFNQDGRRQIVDLLARKQTRWCPWQRAERIERLEQESRFLLKIEYDAAIRNRELKPTEDMLESAEEEDSGRDNWRNKAASAFDDWFFDHTTKAASTRIISSYIRRNADQLVVFTDG